MVDGGESWPVLRCAGDAQDKMMIINRIMPRFRPIAPKPATGGPLSGDSQAENKNKLISNRRSKRKYVRVRKNNNGRKREKRRADLQSNEDGPKRKVVTLQLLPEKAVLEEELPSRVSWCNLDRTVSKDVVQENQDPPTWLNLMKSPVIDDNMAGFGVSDLTVVVAQSKVAVESWVKVECVTEACMGGGGALLGSTDAERMENLGKDTCPGLISDSLNRVQWVNGAYKRMVTVGVGPENDDQDEQWSPEIVVWLVMKKEFPNVFTALTGRVRVESRCCKKYRRMIVPYDVWKMDCGGFAWRLDVEAALSLGPLKK